MVTCYVQHVLQYFPLIGPRLTLKGVDVPNHGVISKDPSVIGEGDDALHCVTDDTTCCGGANGNRQGDWYFPYDVQLLSGTANAFLWYASWQTGAVLMNFRGTATTGTTGLHRCDILDSTDTLHQFYTCIYAEAGDNIFLCKSTTYNTRGVLQYQIGWIGLRPCTCISIG